MAEFFIWVTGITIGVGFCLFVLSLPRITEIFGELRESEYFIVSAVAWVLWLFFALVCTAIVISAIISTFGLAKDLVQYLIKE